MHHTKKKIVVRSIEVLTLGFITFFILSNDPWKEGMHEESDSWKEDIMCQCMEDLMKLGLGFW
jgi:hypothetical protein